MALKLEVDYTKIRGTTSTIRKEANGHMTAAKTSISKAPDKLTKGYGDTKDAIETQTTAEVNMMAEMISLCNNLANSLDNVATSYQNIDNKMSTDMKYKEEKQ